MQTPVTPVKTRKNPEITLSGDRLGELKNRNLFFFGSLATLFIAMLFLFGKQIKAKVMAGRRTLR